jgi:trans-2,3-dihydro-3-hydroxyanthranilate isomerase
MHQYTVVDAFARRPLEGNPVAVFFDADDLGSRDMQRIAAEMHLSECTFVLAAAHGGDARIRIFTPVNELRFAGHPLLGTALALHRTTGLDRLELETAMGTIDIEVSDGRADSALIRMQQPVPTWEPYEFAGELLNALGSDVSTLPVEVYRNGPRHVFVGMPDIDSLSALTPDHRALSQLPDVAANCFAGSGIRWRSRMFSPAYGVVEDAATGSAAGPLAVHLARYGLAEYGQQIRIRQGVEMGRPCLMLAKASGTGERVESVLVCGHAVVVAHGIIRV